MKKDLTNPEEVVESIVFQIDRLDEKSLKLFRNMNYPIRCGACGKNQEGNLELIQVTAVVFLNYEDGTGQKQIPIPWKIMYCKNCLASLFQVEEKTEEVMYQ